MMTFQRVQDAETLERYAEATQVHVGVRFPLEYLQRSQVYVCFEKSTREIQGGFVIVPEAPFRVLTSLPEGVLQGHDFFEKVTEKKMCELTALWLSPKARTAGVSFRLWTRAYFEMLRSGKSHFIYSYALWKTHLQKIFATASPEILFRGETKILPGMSAPEAESVEAISIWTMATVLFRKPRFFLDRLVSKRKGA